MILLQKSADRILGEEKNAAIAMRADPADVGGIAKEVGNANLFIVLIADFEGLDFKGNKLYTVFHPVTKPIRHSLIYKTKF